MIEINRSLIDLLSMKAKASGRLRMNFNFHERPEDTLHRMLNALELNTYIRPHKHEAPDKREAFIILRGSALIVEFDNNGEIIQHIILNHEMGNFGVEIPPRTFHTLISLEEGTVIYEIKDGPYDINNDKMFASWAPEELSGEGNDFNRKILEKLNLHS